MIFHDFFFWRKRRTKIKNTPRYLLCQHVSFPPTSLCVAWSVVWYRMYQSSSPLCVHTSVQCRPWSMRANSFMLSKRKIRFAIYIYYSYLMCLPVTMPSLSLSWHGMTRIRYWNTHWENFSVRTSVFKVSLCKIACMMPAVTLPLSINQRKNLLLYEWDSESEERVWRVAASANKSGKQSRWSKNAYLYCNTFPTPTLGEMEAGQILLDESREKVAGQSPSRILIL